MAVTTPIDLDTRASAAAVATYGIRPDLEIIAGLVEPGARVLDIGCGDGALLHFLATEKQVDGRGIELSQAGVNACVRRGLSVVQGDADNDLDAYPEGAFDYVILSQTLQATRHPRRVLESLTRIGERTIVSFPNFAYWRVRLSLLLSGRMPKSAILDQSWYDTPNIHLCTVRDFLDLTREMGLHIERGVTLGSGGGRIEPAIGSILANWIAEQAIFLLRRDGADTASVKPISA